MRYTPLLKELQFGTEEYKKVLADMGSGLQEHYKNNLHHPEHYTNGINDMTLLSLTEMLVDWMVAANGHINFENVAERFGIGKQLLQILENTDVAFGFMYREHKK